MFNFPWSNFHELNLDWILKVVKEAKDIWTEGRADIDYAVATADDAKEIATQAAEAQVADNSVSTAKIQDGAVTNVKLADNSVSTAKIQDDAVTNAKMADDSVSSDNIQDGAVTFAKLANPVKSSFVSNRLYGKTIAIYGDSWATAYNGYLGANYIESVTGTGVHVRGVGSLTMSEILGQLWDDYLADIYIIEGGLNDKAHNVGATTFTNAITNFCTAIRAINPNAEIFFVTPPFIRTTPSYTKLFPDEFYRIGIWRLSNICNYHVINGLKWSDVKLRPDGVHPIEASHDLVGKHIVNALQNYGDEETHVTEFSNFNSVKSNQITLLCDGGEISIKFQNYATQATGAGEVEQSLGGDIDTIFSTSEILVYDNVSGNYALLRYSGAAPNKITFYETGLASGANFRCSFGFLPLTVNAWDSTLIS